MRGCCDEMLRQDARQVINWGRYDALLRKISKEVEEEEEEEEKAMVVVVDPAMYFVIIK